MRPAPDHRSHRVLLLFLLAACAGIAGCATVPDLDYYVLDLQPTGSARAPLPVRVELLDLNDPLGRPGLMVQVSPARIEYYAEAHWGGSLADLVRDKLALELAAPRVADAVPPGPTTGRNGAYGPAVVSGRILDFHQVESAAGTASAYARLALDVDRLVDGLVEPWFQRVYEARTPLEHRQDPESLARALSTALVTIAQELATDMREFLPPQADPGP